MTDLDFHVFDTTLRDGAQREGVSYSVADKLAVGTVHEGPVGGDHRPGISGPVACRRPNSATSRARNGAVRGFMDPMNLTGTIIIS